MMRDDLHNMTRAELLSLLKEVEDSTRRILSSPDDGTGQFIVDGRQLEALNASGAELLAAIKVLDDATRPIEEAMADTVPAPVRRPLIMGGMKVVADKSVPEGTAYLVGKGSKPVKVEF